MWKYVIIEKIMEMSLEKEEAQDFGVLERHSCNC